MSKPGLTAALTILTILLPLATAARAAPISGGQEGWAAISACARTPDDEARRDCMDGVLRRAGLLNGRAPDPVAAGRDEGRPRFLGIQLPAPAAGSAADLTVAKSQIDYDGRLLFVTSDGQRWRSQDIGAPRPEAGQAITISSTAVGASECRLGKWETFLCVRDNPVR